MKEVNYWNQFWATGKIDDYLNYRAASCSDINADSCDNEKDKKETGSGAFYSDASFIR